jgi:hypothetical protein
LPTGHVRADGFNDAGGFKTGYRWQLLVSPRLSGNKSWQTRCFER